MKAVAYYRCSGQAQISGDTWERQQAAVLRYAVTAGFDVVEEFRDEGISGKTELEGRHGLTSCMAYLAEHSIKVLLVESSDRLARDLLIAEVLIREFQKLGVRVIAASGGVDLTEGDDSNPTAKLIRQILAAVAEFDRCVTVNRMRVAKQRIRATTGRCEGVKPYGDDDGEKATHAVMHLLRREGHTYSTIATMLNHRGHPTRGGKPWKTGTVAKILSREAA